MRITNVYLVKIVEKVGELTKLYSNLPESYIKRSMEQIEWKNPPGPQYRKVTLQRKTFRFTTNRPWTQGFYYQNPPGKSTRRVVVEPILEWSFFKGDRVEVLVGRDKGKQGIVNQVIQERNWVIVEGLNTHLRAIGRSKDFPGVYVRSEAPLLVTNQVALVDPADLKPTTVEWRFTESGDKVRVSTRTGRVLSIPVLHSETYDYKTRSTYKESEKDTTSEALSEITFQPHLGSFEMELMKELKIKEDRIPAPTYWY